MRLNSMKPSLGSKSARKRVGRGIGSTLGKTCGRGHKGQKSRSGGFHKVGFEGGQMPLQRRLPKFGFSSRVGMFTAEVRLHELAQVEAETVTLAELKKAGIVPIQTRQAKIINSGKLEKSVRVQGIKATKGAQAAIESAGGKIE